MAQRILDVGVKTEKEILRQLHSRDDDDDDDDD